MRQTGSGWRHELKYLVDERDLALISAAIAPLTKPDAYHPEGAYRIRSVYYDDPWDRALRSNLDGISPRSKYRIRIYGDNVQEIHLEKKIKDHDLTCKKSCLISQEECGRLLIGPRAGTAASFRSEQREGAAAFSVPTRPPEPAGASLPEERKDEDPAAGRAAVTDRPLFKEFEAYAAAGLLRPAVVVEYERTAFTCREGNVRITFDRNLSTSPYVLRFADGNLPKRPVLPAGQQLLEIKYDAFLPGYLRKALNTGKLERTTFSKYAMCRMCGAPAMPSVRQHQG